MGEREGEQLQNPAGFCERSLEESRRIDLEPTRERGYSHASNTNNHRRHQMWGEHNNLADADH